MARSVLGLMSRRFGAPRAAAIVLVTLTALAAFCIAAGPSAFITLTRIEAGHQVRSVHPAARDLGGIQEQVPEHGPATGTPDPRLGPHAATTWGAIYDDLAAARDAWPASARAIIMEGSAALQSGGYNADADDIGDTALGTQIRFLADPERDRHVRLVEGRLPVPKDPERIVPGDPDWTDELDPLLESATEGYDPYTSLPHFWRTSVEIALLASTAERVGWAVGESRAVQLAMGWQDPPPTTTVTLVGTLELVDPDDVAWWEIPRVSPTELTEVSSRPRLVTAAFVAPELAGRIVPGVGLGLNTLYVWFPVDPDAVPSLETAGLRADVEELMAQPIVVGGVEVELRTLTADALADALARTDSTAAVLGIAVSGPIAVSIALIAVAGGLILRRRASADRLLTGRGMSLARLRWLLLAEGLLLGLPVAAAAVVVARLVTAEDAGWAPDAVAVAIGFAPALALLGASADPLAKAARATDLGAPPRGRGWIRVLMEVLVWALAAAGAALMIMRGDGAGAHPLVILAPVLVAAAVGLLAVRIYPWAVRGILAASRRWRGPVGLVGAARTLRDPIVGGVAQLAVIVVVATVAFSATMLTTMQRGADVAGARAAGADLRITGPTFDPGMVERVEGIPGVSAVATVANVNAVSLSGAGSMNLSLIVLDPQQVATVQEGMIGGFDPSATPALAAEPAVELLLGPGLAARLEGATLSIRGVPVRVVGTVSTVLGMTLAGDWAIVSPEGYERLFGTAAAARTMLIRLDDEIRAVADAAAPETHGGPDVAAIMADIATAVNEPHSMTNYWQHRARIAGSPAVIALKTSLLIALGLSVLLAAVAFLLVAGVTRDDRARTIALLSTLGTDRRQQLGIVSWEFVPIALAGIVAGGVLGTLIPWLAVTGVNLRPFTAGRAQPALSIDPVLLATMGAAALAAIGLVILAEVQHSRRVPVVDVLRSEDHG